jgi:hypothetical protein
MPAVHDGIPAALLPPHVHQDVVAILEIADGVHRGGAVLVLVLSEDGHPGANDLRQREETVVRVRPPLEQGTPVAVQVEGPQVGIQPPAYPLLELLDLFGSGGRIREVMARDLFEQAAHGRGHRRSSE